LKDAQDVRLIERWLPIAELGEECNRERRSMTALPPVYYLHVWWARRPLVASRAAVLASLLPADADRKQFTRALGILGDPIAARKRINEAKRTGVRFAGEAYTYKRAFTHNLSNDEMSWIRQAQHGDRSTVLDPMAGGGAIPFESIRTGFNTVANDLNPVAALLLRLTIDAPRQYGRGVISEFRRLADRFIASREERLAPLFPKEPDPKAVATNYLWARTVHCPYCDGLVPLSPSWELGPDGRGVRLLPSTGGGPNTAHRICSFEIVNRSKEHSDGTITGGDAICPYPDCGRVIDGDEVKRQAQSGGMGEQLFAVAFKRRVEKRTKTGKVRFAWERGYRAPRPEDDILSEAKSLLASKLPVWEARDFVPSEEIPNGLKTSEPIRYGMVLWRDLFNPRQLYVHGTEVEVYRELLEQELAKGELASEVVAAFGYLALSIDKFLNYNSRICRWHTGRELTVGVFDRHDFSFYWSYAEMVPVVTGIGNDWAIDQTEKCIGELVDLLCNRPDMLFERRGETPDLNVGYEDATHLPNVPDGSIDAIVIDPPYYGNVMYAELSDFFYVWLKRTAGMLYPELFRLRLTDKMHEAVANPARYDGARGAKDLADADYRTKMAAIFNECRRVIKPDGIMTLMFTHKATGAWDALAQGLIEAGFVITASWPINTEPQSSLHIRDKAAANSTILLVCRPRRREDDSVSYWDDLERQVREAVRTRVDEFQRASIRGVDLYLASFGPALEVFSRHWPVQRVTPRVATANGRSKRKKRVDEIPFDPYGVTPEDALDAARTEVKRWRLEQLSQLAAHEGLDSVSSWFVLAWDAFESAIFPYDEGLRLARVCGVSMDDEIVNRYAGKKGDNVILWDSSMRASKHVLGPPDGSRSLLDSVHHAAHLARSRSLDSARAMLEENGLVHRSSFVAAFDAVRQVLPVSQEYSGEALPTAAIGAGDDFKALEELRKLLYAAELPPPHQLDLLPKAGV